MEYILYLWALGTPFSMAVTNISMGLGVLAILPTIESLFFIFPALYRSFCLFFIATFISAINGLNPVKSLWALTSHWDFAGFFVFPLLPLQKIHIRRATNFLLNVGLLVALYAIFQFFFGTELTRFEFSPHWIPGHHARAFFSTKLTYGAHASSLFLLSLSLAFFSPDSLRNFFNVKGSEFFYPVLFFLGLLASGTRSYYIGSMGAVALFVLFFIKRRHLLVFSLTALIFSSGIMLVLPPLRARVLSSFDLSKNQDRINIYRATFRAFTFYRWLGIGNGNTEELIPPFRAPLQKKMNAQKKAGLIRVNTVITDVTHAHNNVLQILLNYGVMGFICYLLISIYLFIELYRCYCHCQKNSFESAFIVGVILCWVNFHLGGLFEHNFGDSEVMLLQSALTGLALKLTMFDTVQKPELYIDVCANQ